MAAPHVAGAFAALKSAAPKATVIEMIEAVRQTGFSVLDPRNGRSQPRIRVDKAIEKLRQIVATRPAKPAPKPEPKAEPTPKPKIEAKPTPKLEPAPKSENIDGIRIESDPAVVGEDGKIEW